MHQRVRFQYNV